MRENERAKNGREIKKRDKESEKRNGGGERE